MSEPVLAAMALDRRRQQLPIVATSNSCFARIAGSALPSFGYADGLIGS